MSKPTTEDIVWSATVAQSCIEQLNHLFCAITDLAEENSHTQNLAKIGKNLSDDFGNMFDLEREGWESGTAKNGVKFEAAYPVDVADSLTAKGRQVS